MTTIRKLTGAVVLVTTGLFCGSVFAQADQANENAAGATARAEEHTDADSRATRDGDTITTKGAVVTKEDGSRAQVTTPDRGRANVQTPNRGLAAESRPGRPQNPSQGKGRN